MKLAHINVKGYYFVVQCTAEEMKELLSKDFFLVKTYAKPGLRKSEEVLINTRHVQEVSFREVDEDNEYTK